MRTNVSPRWPCRSGALTTQGATGSSSSARLRDAGRGEALALPRLGGRERRGRPSIGCGSPSRSATRAATPDGPVRAGRDDPVDVLGAREAVDRRLVLGRDERPLVRVREAGRGRIAIDRDHEEVALARGAQEPDLRRPRA